MNDHPTACSNTFGVRQAVRLLANPNDSFTWARTNEGDSFWQYICSRLNELANLNENRLNEAPEIASPQFMYYIPTLGSRYSMAQHPILSDRKKALGTKPAWYIKN